MPELTERVKSILEGSSDAATSTPENIQVGECVLGD